MGNTPNTAAVTAMGDHLIMFDRARVLKLPPLLRKIAEKDGNPAYIHRDDVLRVLNMLQFAPTDVEILNHLFTTMCDNEDWAYYKDYIVAISLLVQGSKEEKIFFVMEAHNAIIDGKKLIAPIEMNFVLNKVNHVLGCCGDATVHKDKIWDIVQGTFEGSDLTFTGKLAYKDYIDKIFEQRAVIEYLNAIPIQKGYFEK